MTGGNENNTNAFYLGSLRVDPATGVVSCGETTAQLEPLVMKVLVSLASHHPDVVSKEQLLAEVWGNVVVSDDAISRSVYQLRKSLASLLKDSGSRTDAGKVIRTLRKRGYQLGLPVSKSSPGEDGSVQTAGNRSRWPIAAGVALLALLAWAGIALRDQSAEAPLQAGPRRVAVVPFESLSRDPDIEFLTRGLSEELNHALANARDLTVTAHASSVFLQSENSDLTRYFDELDVSYLVRGSVRNDDDEMRITVQVINADDRELFSRSYDRRSESLIQIQKQIARDVVAVVSDLEANQDLFPGSTDDVVAYDLYVRGREAWKSRNAEGVLRAVTLFQSAIETDPGYALAYSGLADAYGFSAFYAGQAVAEISDQAQQAVDQALALSPDLPQAHASQGLLYYLQGEHEKADNALRRAIELGPNYIQAYSWRGLTLVALGRYQDALDVYLGGAQIDPLNASLHMNIGANLMLLGRYDDGIVYLRRAADVPETRTLAERTASYWSSRFGRLDDALYWARRAQLGNPDDVGSSAVLTASLVRLGRFEEARLALGEDPGAGVHQDVYLGALVHLVLASGDAEGMARVASQIQADLASTDNRQLSISQAYRLKLVLLNAVLEGNFELALNSMNRMPDDADPVRACAVGGEPGYAVYGATAYAATGQQEDADALIALCLDTEQQIIERGSGSANPYYRIAGLHALAGDDEQAVESLEIAYEKGWRDYFVIQNDPIWASRIERDPYRAFFDRVRDDIEKFNEKINAQ